MQNKRCTRCGASIDLASGYCPHCGAQQPISYTQGGYAPPYQPAGPRCQQQNNTATLVLGIVGIICAFFVPIVGCVCAVIGLVMSIQNSKNGQSDTTGKLLSGAALVILVGRVVLSVLFSLLGFGLFLGFASLW